jgi:MYXO-CTERM domain-containing protein
MAPLTHPDPTNATPDEDRSASQGGTDVQKGPVSTLRGAGAQVDGGTVAKVALGLVVTTLAVLVVVFVIVGADKNQQINELRGQGVPVTFTVTSCQGLLGGSGSNGAGYACRGTYHLDGHTYDERLPGTAFFAPGASVHAIAVPSDPGLVSPVSIVESEHASWRVYLLPGVLLAALLVVVAAILWRRRRRRDSV